MAMTDASLADAARVFLPKNDYVVAIY